MPHAFCWYKLHGRPLTARFQRIPNVVIVGETLDLDKSYKVASNNFTVRGGDAH
ncbi:MAG: 5'-nucleotidase C-terminal domain-containing protein [Armatimonadetes bacterium]|nr:5'-nucleotidase C-terminal domain-containing protein [Armatimonadota bacterium]